MSRSEIWFKIPEINIWIWREANHQINRGRRCDRPDMLTKSDSYVTWATIFVIAYARATRINFLNCDNYEETHNFEIPVWMVYAYISKELFNKWNFITTYANQFEMASNIFWNRWKTNNRITILLRRTHSHLAVFRSFSSLLFSYHNISSIG